MAIPTQTTDDRKIYIIDISMGSQFRGRSWDLDDMNRQTEYKFTKQQRNDIGAVRQSVNVAINGTCMRFYKTRYTNAAGKATLQAACEKADRQMKEIFPGLHVTAHFHEVQTSSYDTSMLEQMKKQLSLDVHNRILKRVKLAITRNVQADGTTKPLTGKTRDALLKMLEKLEEINILQDQGVTDKIAEARQQIENNSLLPLRDDIEAYISSVESANDLEVVQDEGDDEQAITPEDPEADTEEKKYEARPVTNEHKIPVQDLVDIDNMPDLD